MSEASSRRTRSVSGQPRSLLADQETDDKSGFGRPFVTTCRFRGGVYLEQSQPCVIQEYPPSRRQSNAARSALQ
jgi:hypothetical protein